MTNRGILIDLLENLRTRNGARTFTAIQNAEKLADEILFNGCDLDIELDAAIEAIKGILVIETAIYYDE